jgi:hypothetical protein
MVIIVIYCSFFVMLLVLNVFVENFFSNYLKILLEYFFKANNEN